MMRFLRAIGAALRRSLGFVFEVGSWPLRLFGGGGGRPSIEPPRPPAKIPDLGGQVVDHSLSQARDVKMVRAWALSSLSAGEHQYMPTGLPRAVQAWLPGLTAIQLEKLGRGSSTEISAHIHGKSRMCGVPSVRPLPVRPLVIERAPEPDDGDFDAAIDRVLAAPGRG